jgi:glycine hydroxymethyltransferase
MILCRQELGKAIDKAVFPGTQGGPLMHTIAAKAVCLGEALKPEFKEYATQIIRNAKAFACGLQEEGFKMVSGGTDNHLILLDLRNFGITGKEFEHRLDAVNITTNKNGIPNDPEKPFVTSGLRVGTPAATTRGLREEDFQTLAHLFRLCADDHFEENAEVVRNEVAKICAKYPLYAE